MLMSMRSIIYMVRCEYDNVHNRTCNVNYSQIELSLILEAEVVEHRWQCPSWPISYLMIVFTL